MALILSQQKTLRHSAIPAAISLLVFCLCGLSSCASAQDTPGATPVLDTDFGAPNIKTRQYNDAKRGGQLPELWQDESNSFKVRMDYETVEEGARTYTRAVLSNKEDGYGQMVAALPEWRGKVGGTLELTARSATSVPVTIGIRHRSRPYKFLWKAAPKLGKEWQTLVLPFETGEISQSVGLFVQVQGEGQVDIDRIKLLSSAPASDPKASPEAKAMVGALISSDFGVPTNKVKEIKSEKVNGVLTEPWQDESAWAPLRLKYEVADEQGKTFQRVVLSGFESGRAQIVHPLASLSPDFIYTLEMTLRGRPGDAGAPPTPLTVGVRQRSSPYQFAWQEQVVPAREWENLSFTFSPKKLDGAVGLYIMSSGNGTFDIDRLQLAATTRENHIQALEANYPDGGPRNLLAQTRFPFGLPAGWRLNTQWGDDRGDQEEPKVGADSKTIGPSGSAALHLNGQRAFIVSSAPFSVLLSHRKHVASVSFKGTGQGFWGVYAGDKELARQPLNLNNADWQRQELVFSPDLTARAHTLRFQSEKGFDLWMDAVQVAAGEAGKEFVTQMPAEVALSTGTLTDIHFNDEPATINYAISGDANGATLHFRVVNLYGDSATPKPVKLQGSKEMKGSLQYALFAGRPLGVYRVESWVEDAAGKVISPTSEVVVNRLLRPRYWMKDAPNSPFGSHLISNTQDILLAKSMGVNWARLHDAGSSYIGWNWVEGEKGKWNFRDNKIQLYRKHNLKLLGGLSTTPLWARTMKTSHDNYRDRWSQPSNMEDYANYVSTITQRYKGVIDAYEIWNEPWLSKLFWHSRFEDGHKAGADPQGDYVRLMKAGYQAAKKVDPSIKIAGVNTTTHNAEKDIIDGSAWTRSVVEQGGLEACDIISYHHYMGASAAFPGDEVEQGFAKAFSPILEKSKTLPKPVWMSEGSSLYGIAKSQGFYRHSLTAPSTDNNTAIADQVCRYMVSMMAQGVEKVFLYSMATPGSEWAVLVTASGSMHPAGAAHSHLAWQLEDTKFVKRLTIGTDAFAYLFSGGGRSVAVLAPRGNSTLTLPQGATVAHTDLWGNALPVGAKLGSTLSYLSHQGPVAELEKRLSPR